MTMQIVRVLPVAVAAVLGAAAADRAFKPPSIAVVNISEVFENYEKKKEIEKKLEDEIKAEEKKFNAKQEELKKVQELLKNLQEGSKEHKETTVKGKTLEYELKNWEKELVKQFQDKQMNALKEIRGEITDDIEKYATGMGIGIVLEKQVAAEGKNNSVRWPIAHYVKPELEITADIIQRLNAGYGKTTVPAPSGGKIPVPPAEARK
jgi:Skp family chaperone for outer membrane proteins